MSSNDRLVTSVWYLQNNYHFRKIFLTCSFLSFYVGDLRNLLGTVSGSAPFKVKDSQKIILDTFNSLMRFTNFNNSSQPPLDLG